MGHGFAVERRRSWTDPETGEVGEVAERVFRVRRTSFKTPPLQALSRRLAHAEAALKAPHGKRTPEPEAFAVTPQARVTTHRVADFLRVPVSWQREHHQNWLGRGRPGPNRTKQELTYSRARVSVHRRPQAIAAVKEQAGGRPYGTTAPKARLPLPQAVEQYAGQWQPEPGFPRLKGGGLQVAPIFLRTDRPMRGWRLIVSLGLRRLTVVEVVARSNLRAEGATLSGLSAGAPTQATARPTPERGLAVFEGITLYTVRIGHRLHRQLSQLTALHKGILHYIGLPLSVSTALATG